jgi:hypothetical protein
MTAASSNETVALKTGVLLVYFLLTHGQTTVSSHSLIKDRGISSPYPGPTVRTVMWLYLSTSSDLIYRVTSVWITHRTNFLREFHTNSVRFYVESTTNQ